ncbi:hypothetical protein M3Y98_00788600 [Aphelenchoides besseyi]|nr:hypothetical protein M3Y98_00788600 [Aphelenchoides besseyi]
MVAIRFALVLLLQLICISMAHAQRSFALTDKIAQGNFAYDGPGYAGDIPRPFAFAKRAQRFAYESDSPIVNGRFAKFAKMFPSGQREFAFAFAKRAPFAFGSSSSGTEQTN